MPGRNDVDFNTEYQSNSSGPFKFIEVYKFKNTSKAKIKFIDTGTIIDVYLGHAFKGLVKDPYRKNVCGVGCMGMPRKFNKREYQLWIGMLSRCYNTNNTAYQYYGAKGVTVCEKWLCFEYFLEELSYIPGYDLWLQYPGEYELDKDTLQMHLPESMKVYSLKTCCFINKSDNSRYASKYQNQFEGRRISKYTGVTKDKGKPSFRSNIVVNGYKLTMGSYATEEAAGFMYDYAARFHHPNADPALLNNIPNMTLDKAQAQRRGGKNMCRIINKEMCKIIHK